jgi:3-oxoacyl-[acyl-carrier protein] reductase
MAAEAAHVRGIVNDMGARIMTTLIGKVALVTGGSRGIGAGIVKSLAMAGADVGFTYKTNQAAARSVCQEVTQLGRRCVAVQADSSDADKLAKTIDGIAHELGRLDIFVSSAGALLFKPIDAFTLRDFEEIVALDLRAAFVGAKAALAHLPEGGRIIVISSNIADYAALPTTAFYAMVKAGLDGLCKGMARDLGPRGITVNIVHPGSTDTDMNPADGEHADAQLSLMAIPRFGKPRDIASLIAWLASDESQFVTGAAFTIDGGANT